jgi:cell division protein FtsW
VTTRPRSASPRSTTAGRGSAAGSSGRSRSAGSATSGPGSRSAATGRSRSTRTSPSDLAPVTELRSRAAVDVAEPFADDVATKGRRLETSAPPGRRSKSFVILLSLLLTLNVTGLVMILSASSVSSLEDYGSPWYQFSRQALWFALSLVALVLVMRRDYRRWRRHCGLLLLGSFGLLFLVLVPGVGVEAGGATRWLGYGPLSIQPSELVKLTLIIFWADLLARRAKWIDDCRLTLVPVLLTFLAAAAMIMLQPNLGTTMIIFAVMIAMLFVAGIGGRWIALVLALGAAGAAVFAMVFPWRWKRISAFLDPWADAQGIGYQTIESKTALANGGLTGTGLGEGRSKWGFLPEAHTDFIFSVIAEEAGFMGGLLLIALFITLAVVGFQVAMKAPDRFGALLATGITAWFIVQAFLNIGQAVGALPVMGVPLPFVSSGGSSLLFSMIAAGMLLNVARQTR